MLRQASRLAASLVLVSLSLAAHARKHKQPSDVQAQIVGYWELVSAEERLTDGSTRPYQDVGPNGKGYLIYTADGHMCAAGMDPARPKWRDDDKPMDAEKLRAVNGFFSYCGRYEIDSVHHVIYHHPEVSLDPNMLGTKQRRPYTFDADKLTLSDRDTAPGVASYAITWKKTKRVDQ